ncbi:hypothetical protein QN277_025715 [Acacia crassicarpa]|uniref:CCHC-type domain-containing protein n=1 Tax=Acacia crassicarpa TaxID=499986 RepID=A0AAE1J8L0_9FABA|nr:hypothetical protein QN277_025715 [Acacia crassicarpa]
MEVGQSSCTKKSNQVVLELDDEPQQWGGTLVGKISTSKNLNILAVTSMIKKGWKLDEELEIHELDRDKLIFRFRFRNVSDYARILKGRPWSVQGFLLNLQVWENFMVLQDVNFEEVPFWVQFHGLPVEAFNNANARILGDTVGKAVMFEQPKIEGRMDRSFIRVRSLIRVDTPLVACFWIPRKGLDPAWISVKYERLPVFCYYCGRMNHDGRRCKEASVQLLGEEAVKEFGNWLSTSTVKTKEESLEFCDESWCEVPFIRKVANTSDRRSGKPESPEVVTACRKSSLVSNACQEGTLQCRISTLTVNSDRGLSAGMTLELPSPKVAGSMVTGPACDDATEEGGEYEVEGVQTGLEEMKSVGPQELGLKTQEGMNLFESPFSCGPNILVQDFEEVIGLSYLPTQPMSPTVDPAAGKRNSFVGPISYNCQSPNGLLMQTDLSCNIGGSGSPHSCLDGLPYKVEFPEDEVPNQMIVPVMGLSSVAAITLGMKKINLKHPINEEHDEEKRNKVRKLCMESKEDTKRRDIPVLLSTQKKNRSFRSVKRYLCCPTGSSDQAVSTSIAEPEIVEIGFHMNCMIEDSCFTMDLDKVADRNAGGWVGPTTGSPLIC